ncbi:MAG: alpha,alpha-trehalose-phosphate synthase (UDP-forming) [Bacillota bacterium]
MQKNNQERLVLISNGEPYRHEKTEDDFKCTKLPGGLTTGLDPLMKKEKGLWIAWGRGEDDFKVLNENNSIKVPDQSGYTLKRISLSTEDVNDFYYGFSNEVMWPICHNFVDKANFKKEYWQSYKKVNKKYARAALEEITENDLIWIHDYHLTLVAKELKEKNNENKIALFWHIPWPAWEAFRTIPWKNEIMAGLLANDFFAFHTKDHVKNFLNCADKLGATVDFEKSYITYKGGKTYVSAIPLGVDYKNLSKALNDCEKDKDCENIKKYYHAEKIIFGVDRLDYTKGIYERLDAMEALYEKYPQYIGKVTLIQRISPSRSEVEEYQNMREEINRKIAAINGRFQIDQWQPIKYFHGSVPQKELYPYFQAADIALITPLIDGMNLVAKEYLSVKEDGVLILSKFAGAAENLKEALQVNPYNTEEVVEMIHKAIEMPAEERKKRYQNLRDKIATYDINWWRDTFLKKWKELYKTS